MQETPKNKQDCRFIIDLLGGHKLEWTCSKEDIESEMQKCQEAMEGSGNVMTFQSGLLCVKYIISVRYELISEGA